MIELLVVIVLLAGASVLFFMQKHNIEVARADDQRKMAINAMYYNLEEVFYVQNGYYPDTISKDVLKAVDPTLFTDPNGVAFGEAESDYRYEPTNCTNERCRSYSLRTTLQNEADYVKTNRE